MKYSYPKFIHAILILLFATIMEGCASRPAAIIYIDKQSQSIEEFAAREIRKYIYQRTG